MKIDEKAGKFFNSHVLIIGGPYDGIIADPSCGDYFEFTQAFATKAAHYGSNRIGMKVNGELYTRTYIFESGIRFCLYIHHSIDDQAVLSHLFLGYHRLNHKPKPGMLALPGPRSLNCERNIKPKLENNAPLEQLTQNSRDI